jgi:hypothetical protein
MKLTSNKVKAQYLTVTLCENDTYTMEFVSVNRKFDRGGESFLSRSL